MTKRKQWLTTLGFAFGVMAIVSLGFLNSFLSSPISKTSSRDSVLTRWLYAIFAKLRIIGQDIQVICKGELQWIGVLLCFVTIIVLGVRDITGLKNEERRSHVRPFALLLGFLLMIGLAYVENYQLMTQTNEVIGVVFGIAAASLFGAIFKGESNSVPAHFRFCILGIWTLVLTLGFLISPPSTGFYYAGSKRLTGLSSNPKEFGALMLVGLLFAVALLRFLHKYRGTSSWIQRYARHFTVLSIGAIIVNSYGVICSYSPAAWLGAVVGLWFILRADTRGDATMTPRKILFKEAAFLLLVIAVVSLCLFTRPSSCAPVQRVASCFDWKSGPWQNQLNGYSEAIKTIVGRPLTGAVVPSSTLEHSATNVSPGLKPIGVGNDFIRILVVCGLVGGLPLVVYLVIRFKILFRPLPHDPLSLAFIAVPMGLLIVGIFEGGENGAGIFGPATGFHFWLALHLGGRKTTLEPSSQQPIETCEQASVSGLAVGRKKVLRIGLGAIVLILLIPAMEVAYVAFCNPSTTGPIVLENMNRRLFTKKAPIRAFEWCDLDKCSLFFIRAVWVAEDSHFFDHQGFDWEQIKSARQAALRGQPLRGASTITQQCARSLFLWQGRSWIRKSLEAYYTFWMELLLSKKRIMELYVNVIETGDGIYSVSGAAEAYFGKSAAELTEKESAIIAALLPRPRQANPLRPDDWLTGRTKTILERIESLPFPFRQAGLEVQRSVEH